MKRDREHNTDLTESPDVRFKANNHQPSNQQVQPLAAPTQTPLTTTQPPPKQLPVPPVYTGRILTANLDGVLNPQVTKIVTDRENVMRGNYKLVRGADEAVRLQALPDREKEANRSVAVQMYENLARVRDERLKELRGDAQKPGKALTIDGKTGSVKQAFETLLYENDRPFATPLGNRRGMASTLPNEVRAINPGFKVGSQTLQLLGHLAQVFMNNTNDMEYQAMLVNGRIFVAANEQAAIGSFKDRSLRDLLAASARSRVLDIDTKPRVRAYKIGALCEALKLANDSTAELTAVQEDGAKMLAEYALGHHIDYPAREPLRSLLNILKHQAVNGPKMLGPFTPKQAFSHVADSRYKNEIILVKTPVLTGWHAEQALVQTLALAEWRTGAFVAGTKLPCFGCWLTLNLLPQCGYPLTFTQKPGFIWTTTIAAGMTTVGNQLGIRSTAELKRLCKNAYGHTDNKFLQFMTALDTMDDLNVTVKLGEMGEDDSGLTQAMSQHSFYGAQKAPVPTSIAGAPYPDNVPGSPPATYGTPPGSPRAERFKADVKAYEAEVAELKAAQEKEAKEKEAKEKEAKEAAAKKDAGGTTTTKKDADGTTTAK